MTQPASKNPSESKNARGTTKVTITMPDDLVADLDKLAASDNRTRSNMILYSVRRMIEVARHRGLSMRNRPPNTYCPKSGCYMGPDDAC